MVRASCRFRQLPVLVFDQFSRGPLWVLTSSFIRAQDGDFDGFEIARQLSIELEQQQGHQPPDQNMAVSLVGPMLRVDLPTWQIVLLMAKEPDSYTRYRRTYRFPRTLVFAEPSLEIRHFTLQLRNMIKNEIQAARTTPWLVPAGSDFRAHAKARLFEELYSAASVNFPEIVASHNIYLLHERKNKRLHHEFAPKISLAGQPVSFVIELSVPVADEPPSNIPIYTIERMRSQKRATATTGAPQQ